MVTVDECCSTDVLLSPVGKCLVQEMSSELTSSFLSNLRNPQWKLVYYWLRLTDCLSHPCVFERHKQFSDGRKSVKDDYLGHPCTSFTTNNIEGG